MVYVVLAMKTIRLSDIEKLGTLQCTEREAAAFLDIRTHQFSRLLATDEDVRAAWERGKGLGRISIRRKQMRLGSSNAHMAIFLGKQYLNQKDVVTSESLDNTSGLDLGSWSQEDRNALRELLTRRAKSGKGTG